MTYQTLGDIATELRFMRRDGMTKESIEYALSQVFDEPEPGPLQVKFPAGSRVRLTGESWREWEMHDQIVTVGDDLGETVFQSRGGTFALFVTGDDDYSATLVEGTEES
jgi:hypothetical protein